MIVFNVVDGILVIMNKWFNWDVLWDEMGFDGVFIFDWGVVVEVINYGIVRNFKEVV